MAVTLNAKGTSVSSFTIGKGGQAITLNANGYLTIDDGVDTEQPLGYNTIPIYEIDAADTFDLAHAGMMWHKDAGGAVTFTCDNDSTIPQGSTWIVHNDDAEDITIAQGTGVTIAFLASGAAPTTGDVTVSQGGIVTVYKYTDTEYWVWGDDGPFNILTAGSTTDATLRWNGSAWAENTTITATSTGVITAASTAGNHTFSVDSATTNADIPVMKLSASSTGTPLAGIGPSIQFEAETAAANLEIGGEIALEATDVTATTEDFDFVFNTMAAGAAAAERFRISSTGSSFTTDLSLTGTTHLVLPSTNDAVTPTLAFGDGDSGFYEQGDDAIQVAIAGSALWRLDVSAISFAGGSRAAMLVEVPSATNPVFVPNYSDPDTGIGWNAADELVIVAGGFQGVTIGETDAGRVYTRFQQWNSQTSPTIQFGDGDTGFFELSDDFLSVSTGGTYHFAFTTTSFQSANANGPRLEDVASTATVPTLLPDRSDTDTGIGHNAADQLSLISGGVEMVRLVEDTEDYILSNTPILIAESANAVADVAGYGQYWVGNDNNPYFTPDDGTDYNLLTAYQSGIVGDLTNASSGTFAVPTTVDNTIEFMSLSRTSGAHSGILHCTVSESGFSVAKTYVFSLQYNQTGTGVWETLVPTDNTGRYSSQDFSIEVEVFNNVATFRCRRTAGTTVGDLGWEVWVGQDDDALTIGTPSTTSTSAVTAFINPLSVWDITGNDSAKFTHDGTDFNTVFTNTTDWNVSGLTNSAFSLEDGGRLRIQDSDNNSWVLVSHDGTDLNVSLNNSTDINMTSGITAVNLPEITLTTALDETYGGTGQTTLTTGDILYASAANTFSKLALGNVGEVLTVVGSNVAWNPPAVIEFAYDSTVTAADPGAGTIRFDSVTIGSIANAYIDDLDASGDNAEWILSNLADGDILTFRSITDPLDYIIASVNGSTTDGTGYWTVPLTLIHTGTIFTNGDQMRVSVEWAGSNASVSGFISGTVANNQIVTGTGASTVDSSANLTYDGTTLTMAGASAQLILPQNATPLAPTLAFGDGDTGFYELSDDTMRVSIAGTELYQFSATHISGTASASFYLRNTTVTSTNPSLGPRRDTNTGIGSAENDSMSLIAGGVEMMRFDSTVGGQDHIKTEVPFYMDERAVALNDYANYGQLWVRNDAPNTLMYTNDAGNDFTANNVFEIAYVYSSAVTSTDPGAGTLNFNSVTIGSITTVYIDDVDDTGRDNSYMLSTLADGDLIEFRSASDPADYIVATVNGAPTDSTGFWTISLTLVNTGTIFTNNDQLRIIPTFLSQGPATGTVTSSGTPLNNEVAVFTSGTDIDSDSTFTWDGTTMFATNVTGTNIGGIAQANLLDKSATETVSGEYTFTASPIISAAVPRLYLRDTDATADEGNWFISGANDTFQIATASDAAPTSAVENAITINRAGTAVSNVTINNGDLVLNENLSFDAVTNTIAGIQNQNLLDKTAAETISGVYTHSAGIVITDTTEALALRAGDTSAVFAGDQITFGFDGNNQYQHAIGTRHNSAADTNNAIDFYLWDFGVDTTNVVGTFRALTLDQTGSSFFTNLDISGALTLGTALDEAEGGTGQTTYATGDILYASGANTLAKLAAGTNTHVLTLSGGVPTWAAAPGATPPTTITVANEATDTTCFPLFVTAATGDLGPKTNANLTFNSNTGHFTATSKSFLIKHPTKEGKKLQYGSLEGPEHGVYVRGRLTDNDTIELPDYWTALVDPNSITVNLTPIGAHQELYVADIGDNKVVVGGSTEHMDFFYTVYAERIDVDRIELEIDDEDV